MKLILNPRLSASEFLRSLCEELGLGVDEQADRDDKKLVDQLNRDGVPNVFLALPYNDHAYDVVWGSLGGQITRRVLEDFLQKYLPAAEPR